MTNQIEKPIKPANKVTVGKSEMERDKSKDGQNKEETTEATDTLTAEEVKTLAACEANIKKGKDTFIEVGKALATINEQRLYRSTHDNFAVYCENKWGITKAHAYRLITAFQVVALMVTNGDDTIPQNESQTRVLGKVPASKRGETMARAKDKAGEGRITTTHLKEAAEEIVGEEEDTASEEPDGQEDKVLELSGDLEPIELEQIMAWVETVQRNVKADKNKSASLQLLENILLGLELIISEWAEAEEEA